jgi:hypothetical protein
VKRLNIAVTVFLLALWLPASSHALLEQLGWIHTAHGDTGGASDTDNDDDHDAADGFCRISSTHVQVPQPDLTGGWQVAWTSIPLAHAVSAATSLALSDGPDPPGVAPPELSQSWQFSFRASLPSRAPSLTS